MQFASSNIDDNKKIINYNTSEGRVLFLPENIVLKRPPPDIWLLNMETKKNYGEKLEDPRWQRKRLLIFERDKWKCKLCNDDKNTLHVHHDKYEDGKEPWDINDIFLRTLCKHCHSFVEFCKNTELSPLEIFKIERDHGGVFISVKYKDAINNDKAFFCTNKDIQEWDFIGIFNDKQLRPMIEF